MLKGVAGWNLNIHFTECLNSLKYVTGNDAKNTIFMIKLILFYERIKLILFYEQRT
jgi:hypothetical protein